MSSVSSITDSSSSAMECAHHIPRRPSNFLVLAPVASANYQMAPPVPSPTKEATPAASEVAEAPEAPLWFLPDLASPPIDKADTTAQEIEAMLMQKEGRRSSTSSASGYGRPRFLKLGPVHFGGEPGVPDFTEVDQDE